MAIRSSKGITMAANADLKLSDAEFDEFGVFMFLNFKKDYRLGKN